MSSPASIGALLAQGLEPSAAARVGRLPARHGRRHSSAIASAMPASSPPTCATFCRSSASGWRRSPSASGLTSASASHRPDAPAKLSWPRPARAGAARIFDADRGRIAANGLARDRPRRDPRQPCGGPRPGRSGRARPSRREGGCLRPWRGRRSRGPWKPPARTGSASPRSTRRSPSGPAGIRGPLLVLYPCRRHGPSRRPNRGIAVSGRRLGLPRGDARRAPCVGAPGGHSRVHLEVETGLGRGGFPARPWSRRRRRSSPMPGRPSGRPVDAPPGAGGSGITARQLEAVRGGRLRPRAAGVRLPRRHVRASGSLLGDARDLL